MKNLIALVLVFGLYACGSGGGGGGSGGSSAPAPTVTTTTATATNTDLSVEANTKTLLKFENNLNDATARHTYTPSGTANSALAKVGTGARTFSAAAKDYIDTAIDSDFYFQNYDFEIQFWLKTTQVSAAYVFGTYLPACTSASNTVSFTINNGGAGKGQFIINSTGTNKQIVSTATINDGQWHHIKITNVSGTVSMYVDDAFQGAQTTGAVPLPNARFAIGRPGECDANYYDGALDEFRINLN